jgi:hypothetical protein
MKHGMTREQKKKLLLAEGALYRFECMQARRAIVDELGNIAHSGPTGMLRAVSGRSLLSLAATAVPLLLGAGRVARLLKRGMLVAGGIVAAWSAISRWREQSVDDGAAAQREAAATRGNEAARNSTQGVADM